MSVSFKLAVSGKIFHKAIKELIGNNALGYLQILKKI